MSEVKVNKISPRTGTTFTIGDSGDTISTAGTISANALTVNGESITATQFPTITSISPDTITNAATAVTITGTNFISVPFVDAINASTGPITQANSVTYNSSSSITANFTLTPDGTYYIRIENNDGNAVRSSSAILSVSTAPSFTTAAGSLGTIAGDFSGTVATLVGSSDSTIAFSEVTSGGNVLTASSGANCSLDSATGAITTTDFGGTSTTPTTYTFDIRITDQEGQFTDRQFSLTSSFGATGGGGFN